MASEQESPTIEVTEGGVELPVVDVLTGRGAIFGKSGSGKSNTVGVIAEELLEQNFPLLIIDADGEHYGLKEEYEILHVGATDECDMVVGEEHADALARVALEENVPIILDVSGYLDESRVDDLVRDVVQSLFQRAQTLQVPFPIFVEEAHEFIPESGSTDDTAKALIRVAKRGRKRGLGLTAISQRPANVSKDVITQADWRIWHKLTWKNDTDVVREVMTAELSQAVQDLDVGQALLDADFMGEVRTVQFKRKRTFDLGATPGLEDFERPELQPVSEDIIESLRSITEEAEETESRIEELEAERDRLESRVQTLESEVERLEAGEEGPDAEVVQDLRAEKKRLEDELEEVRGNYASAKEAMEQRQDKIEMLHEELEELRPLRDAIETAKMHLRDAQEALGADVDAEAAALEDEYRERVEKLEAKIDRLERENEQLRESSSPQADALQEYQEFYEDEMVRDILQEAAEESPVYPKAVKGTMVVIKNLSRPVTHDEIASEMGLDATSDITKATKQLAEFGLVTRERETEGQTLVIDYNFEGMNEAKEMRERRQQVEEELAEL